MTTRFSSSTELRGSMTAMVTPFQEGEIDWPVVDRLVERQIAGGTDWLVPCGTTGESPTLSSDEQERLIERVIARSAGRRPVMAGTGSNSTAEAVRRTRFAASAGADAALIVTPYYNRPTQEGLFRHFAAVAEAVDIPIVLYNVQARTAVHLSNETIARLVERFPNVVALKDASGVVDHVTDLLSRCSITVLCGDDALTWPFISLGAKGVISVLSNLVPEWMKSLVDAGLAGNRESVSAMHRRVYDLAMGLARFGPNPVPIKTAMAIRGLLSEEFRLPLCPLEADARAGVERVLRRHEILERAVA